MKITSTALAKACVTLLLLYPCSAILVSGYLESDYYGVLAALFAANAGAALLVSLVFRLPEFDGHTSSLMNMFVVFIGVGSGLFSAFYWMTDEVEHIWLRLGIIAPVFAILLVLVWFAIKVDKERMKR